MTIITCIDKDGNSNNFKYVLKHENTEDGKVWKFSVIPEDDQFIDFYYLTATEINKNKIKITMINHHNQPMYSAKGITEKLIEVLHSISEMNVASSSNNKLFQSFKAEYRTPPATKVWMRLIEQGLAIYDEESDTFNYIGD